MIYLSIDVLKIMLLIHGMIDWSVVWFIYDPFISDIHTPHLYEYTGAILWHSIGTTPLPELSELLCSQSNSHSVPCSAWRGSLRVFTFNHDAWGRWLNSWSPVCVEKNVWRVNAWFMGRYISEESIYQKSQCSVHGEKYVWRVNAWCMGRHMKSSCLVYCREIPDVLMPGVWGDVWRANAWCMGRRLKSSWLVYGEMSDVRTPGVWGDVWRVNVWCMGRFPTW